MCESAEVLEAWSADVRRAEALVVLQNLQRQAAHGTQDLQGSVRDVGTSGPRPFSTCALQHPGTSALRRIATPGHFATPAPYPLFTVFAA